MKRSGLIICLAIPGLIAGSSAFALPPINTEWKAKYLGEDTSEEFQDAVRVAKCRVCHLGGGGAPLNDYGRAVRQFLKKKDINEIKADPEKLKKFLDDGLEKAAAEKSSSGKTFGELIKEGKLPGDK